MMLILTPCESMTGCSCCLKWGAEQVKYALKNGNRTAGGHKRSHHENTADGSGEFSAGHTLENKRAPQACDVPQLVGGTDGGTRGQKPAGHKTFAQERQHDASS